MGTKKRKIRGGDLINRKTTIFGNPTTDNTIGSKNYQKDAMNDVEEAVTNLKWLMDNETNTDLKKKRVGLFVTAMREKFTNDTNILNQKFKNEGIDYNKLKNLLDNDNTGFITSVENHVESTNNNNQHVAPEDVQVDFKNDSQEAEARQAQEAETKQAQEAETRQAEEANVAKQEEARQAEAKQEEARQAKKAAQEAALAASVIGKFKNLQSITRYEDFSFPIDKDGNYIDSTKPELDQYKKLDEKAFGLESAIATQKNLQSEVANKLEAQKLAQKNYNDVVTTLDNNNKTLTDLNARFSLKKDINIDDYKTTLDEFGATDINTHSEKTIKDFSNSDKVEFEVDFDKKKSFWIAFLKMAQLAFVIQNYKTKITGEENVKFINQSTEISKIEIQAFLQMYKQTGGKQSDGKQSDGKQSGGKQSDSKQSDGGNCKYKYVKLLIEKIQSFNNKLNFDTFISSSIGATNVSSGFSKLYDKKIGNQKYQNKNDKQISLCFINVFGYSVDDQPILQGDSEYKNLLKTFLTRTREILTDSDFNQAMNSNNRIFNQTDIAKPSILSGIKLEDEDQKKFLQKAVVFFNNSDFINKNIDSNEYKGLAIIQAFLNNTNYLFGKIITQNNPAKTKITKGALESHLIKNIETEFNKVNIPDTPVKKAIFPSFGSGGSRKRNNKSGKKQLVRGGKKSIKHKISPNKTHKKQ